VQVSDRLEALDAATRAIAGVLDADTVLQRIADSVRTLVSAEHAALGVVEATGRIELFITSGISREERERIGALPRGRGLLGLIIRAGRSYRIADISDHPDSYGFPPNHPPMTSLGVPVTVAGGSIGKPLFKRDAAEFRPRGRSPGLGRPLGPSPGWSSGGCRDRGGGPLRSCASRTNLNGDLARPERLTRSRVPDSSS